MLSLFGISLQEGGPRDGIHLLWTPPFPTGHSLDGFTLRRRQANQGKPRRECFDVDDTVFGSLHRYGHDHVPGADVWARSWTRVPEVPTHLVHGWTYRFDLTRSYDEVEIVAEASIAFAAREADGKMVDAKPFASGRVTVRGGGIARVWIVTSKPLAKARICGVLADPDWSKSTVVVAKLQLPFASVDPTLSGIRDELARARSRLLAGETLDGDFEACSQTMNTALRRPYALPAWHVVAAQPTPRAKDVDIHPFGYGLSLTLVPSWRRALGLGWLDAAKQLTPGATYDYRLEGTIPRCDRDERRIDFHSVPRGTQLPIAFRIGPAEVFYDRSPVVETTSPVTGDLAPLHKGTRFRRLALIFDEPLDALVLHGASDDVSFEATLPGTATRHTGSVRLAERTELRFPTPITELRLRGAGLFAGFTTSPVPAGTDPRAPVPVATAVHGIQFVPTPAPSAPRSLEITPLRGRGAHPGFELGWLPPDHVEILMEYWPTDADSAPPTTVSWYELERADNDGAFRPIDDSVLVSSRNAAPTDETVCLGMNLLERFPPHDRGGRMTTAQVRARDVFGKDDTRVPWGTQYSYRVRAVDPIGRRSPAAEAGRCTLEKHLRPPPPSSPEALRDPPELPDDKPRTPAGVQARVIEAATATTDADRALLGTHDAVAVVRWGWGTEERELDPDVREFRVYTNATDFWKVQIDITGAATLSGDHWRLPCSFDRVLDADELADRTVVLAGRAFRVVEHGAGPATALVLERSSVAPDAIPSGTTLTILRSKRVGDDPEHWDARVQVVPERATIDHEAVIALDWLRPTAARPRVEGWIGVTACDAEEYIHDRRAGEARPGNESTVASVRIVRRYHGRAALEPQPLGPVTSVALPRCEGDQLVHTLRPGAHGPVPAGTIRVERCASGPLLRSLTRLAGGVALRRRRPDETRDRVEPWELAPADAARLLAQMGARAIDDHFLPHIAAALGVDADAFFTKVADIAASASCKDTVPNHQERYVYRVRALDEGGRASVAAQVLSAVFAPPLRTEPPIPEIAVQPGSVAGSAVATVRLAPRAGADVRVVLFHGFARRSGLPAVELAWIRNRPELPLARAAILRDDRGERLTAMQLEPVDGVATHEIAIPVGHRVHVWALAVSAAGVPSRLAGPRMLSNGVPLEA